MTNKDTFIKLNRNILKWRWYQDASASRLFIHFILKANVHDHDFRNITIHRGQLVTSVKSLSEELGMTPGQVRTALDHLQTTGEIDVVTSTRYSVVTVFNYDSYQISQKTPTANKKISESVVGKDFSDDSTFGTTNELQTNYKQKKAQVHNLSTIKDANTANKTANKKSPKRGSVKGFFDDDFFETTNQTANELQTDCKRTTNGLQRYKNEKNISNDIKNEKKEASPVRRVWADGLPPMTREEFDAHVRALRELD